MPLPRADRALSLWVFRWLQGAARKDGKRPPILMYHSISDDPETGVHVYYRVATHPARFAEQMGWLAEHQCIGLSLEEALETPATGRADGRRVVALTFDDGFRDFHTCAWPVLRRYGFRATVFLPTAFISDQRLSFRKKECLTWDEVRELRAEGIRFGSHSATHPKLYGLAWKAIADELSVSKAALDKNLGKTMPSFAYPYAFPQEDASFAGELSRLVQESGYRACATTMIGRSVPSLEANRLRRLPVNSCDDRDLFIAKLDGAYDWLGLFQNLSRRAKLLAGRGRPRRAPLQGATAAPARP